MADKEAKDGKIVKDLESRVQACTISAMNAQSIIEGMQQKINKEKAQTIKLNKKLDSLAINIVRRF